MKHLSSEKEALATATDNKSFNTDSDFFSTKAKASSQRDQVIPQAHSASVCENAVFMQEHSQLEKHSIHSAIVPIKRIFLSLSGFDLEVSEDI